MRNYHSDIQGVKKERFEGFSLANTARHFFVVVVLLISFGSLSLPAQEKVPNDPYYKYQFSFHNPGGQLRINTRSYKPSMKEVDAEKGIDVNIGRAWGGFDKETNGVDDNHNGYVDDVVGWDFAFDHPDPDCHVFDGMDKSRIAPYWHSLHAMGIIEVKGNNGIGVAGINWDVSMMLLEIGAQGIERGQVDTFRVERAAKAIRYAADNGALESLIGVDLSMTRVQKSYPCCGRPWSTQPPKTS